MADLRVPTVIEQTATGERSFDLYSRLLHDRIVFLGTPLDDAVANLLTAQFLMLEHEDPDADINLYVNSPGGSMTALFGVYDVLQYVRPDVATTCMGMAASAAAVLLAAGTPGKRHALPNARVLIHQPHGQIPESQASDIGIHAAEALRQRQAMNEVLARHTGRPVDEIARDTDRDRIMSAEEARDYGLVDEVISARDLKMSGYVPEEKDGGGNGRRR